MLSAIANALLRPAPAPAFVNHSSAPRTSESLRPSTTNRRSNRETRPVVTLSRVPMRKRNYGPRRQRKLGHRNGLRTLRLSISPARALVPSLPQISSWLLPVPSLLTTTPSNLRPLGSPSSGPPTLPSPPTLIPVHLRLHRNSLVVDGPTFNGTLPSSALNCLIRK